MDVKHTYVASQYLDQLPIENGQLIVLKDGHRMYYDMDGTRHSVESEALDSAVMLDTEQTVVGFKKFHDIQVDQLTQGKGCTAVLGTHSEGQNSKATVANTYAHAEGGSTSATGKYSHSEGENTTAEGVGSHASGNDTYAVGDYSSAIGVNTVSSGKGSMASGLLTNAVSDYSAVFGVGNSPEAGDLLEVGNGEVLDSNGQLLPEESQTRSNAFRVTADGRALAQTDFELASGVKLSDRESVSNKVTSITSKATDSQYPSALAVKKLVDSIPDPMIFKGTLGTGGTIASLPSASASNTGHTYKVITAGTYASQSAKIGDTFISDGKSWVIIPSGDEPEGTVTNVAATGSNGIQVTGGPITSSGTFVIQGVNASQSSNGMMTAADKKKLDSVNNYGECSTARNIKDKVVTINGITSLYAGLKIAVRFTDTTTSNPASGNLTLNVNGLGAKEIIDAKTNRIKLTYSYAGWLYNNIMAEFVYDGTYWNWVSNDNNTKNSAGASNKTGTKMFLVGTTSQTNGTTSYSNSKCYVGTDNELYSNTKKVAHAEDVGDLTKISSIGDGTCAGAIAAVEDLVVGVADNGVYAGDSATTVDPVKVSATNDGKGNNIANQFEAINNTLNSNKKYKYIIRTSNLTTGIDISQFEDYTCLHLELSLTGIKTEGEVVFSFDIEKVASDNLTKIYSYPSGYYYNAQYSACVFLIQSNNRIYLDSNWSRIYQNGSILSTSGMLYLYTINN